MIIDILNDTTDSSK